MTGRGPQTACACKFMSLPFPRVSLALFGRRFPDLGEQSGNEGHAWSCSRKGKSGSDEGHKRERREYASSVVASSALILRPFTPFLPPLTESPTRSPALASALQPFHLRILSLFFISIRSDLRAFPLAPLSPSSSPPSLLPPSSLHVGPPGPSLRQSPPPPRLVPHPFRSQLASPRRPARRTPVVPFDLDR